jgi:hypothetical protein
MADVQPSPDITQLLSSIGKGDQGAAAQLLEVVYAELHRLAARYMSRERVDHTPANHWPGARGLFETFRHR